MSTELPPETSFKWDGKYELYILFINLIVEHFYLSNIIIDIESSSPC